jgi:hypothetical protein
MKSSGLPEHSETQQTAAERLHNMFDSPSDEVLWRLAVLIEQRSALPSFRLSFRQAFFEEELLQDGAGA